MRYKVVTIASIGLSLVVLLSACSRDPENYDECILKYIKAGMNERAVHALQKSCQARYPNTIEQNKSRPLTGSELKLLDGRASLSFDNYFAGNLYNGNTALKITEIEIVVFSTKNGAATSKNYREETSISPLTTSSFGVSIILGDPQSKYNWALVSARGTDQ